MVNVTLPNIENRRRISVLRRRVVLALGAGAILAPIESFAQQRQVKVFRIGLLGAASASSSARWLEKPRAGLRDFDYLEDKNIAFEYRWAEGNYDRLAEMAEDLVRLRVDVIVTHGTPGTRAAKATAKVCFWPKAAGWC